MIRRMLILFLSCLLIFGLPFAVWAQDDEEVGQDQDIVVTANRTPTDSSEAPGSVDVVTQEQIDQTNPGTGDLADLLSLWTGVQINSNGNDGAITTLNLRGSGSEQVLVMLDGVPLVNPQNGTASLSFLSLDIADRIEIVQGPLSSLYGADAVGGTINIIPGSEPGGRFRTGIGSFGSKDFHFSYIWENAGFFAGKSLSDGYRPNSQFEGDWQFAYIRPTLGSWDMEFGYYRYSDDKHLPGSVSYPTPTAVGRDGQNVFYATAKTQTDQTQTVLKLYQARMGDYYRDDWQTGDSHADRLGAEVQNNWTINTQFTLLTVARWERSGVECLNYESVSRTGYNRDLSAQLIWSLNDKMKVYYGDLFTNSSIFGGNDSPRFAVVYQADPDWTLKTVVSRAFRAPTFNELYWQDPYMQGNENLKPEISSTVEFDAEYLPADGRLTGKIAFYRTLAKNLIEWMPDSNYYVWTATNHQMARLEGFDGSVGYKLTDQWSVNAQAHLLRALDYDPASGRYDDVIASKVPASAVFSLLYDGGKVQGAWFTRYFQGHGPIGATAVSDLALSYGIDDSFRLSLGVQNIFDRDYCFNYDYPMPGINVRLELSYKF